MKQEDYTDNLNKDHQDAEYLSTVRHVEENAENIDGKQRQYHCTDHADDNLLKIACRIFQYLTFQMSQAQPQCEGKYECGHNIHQGRDTHGKIGKNALRLTDFF